MIVVPVRIFDECLNKLIISAQTMSFSSESEFWDAEEYNTADDASSTSSSDMDDRDLEDLEVDDDGACNMDR